jgi:hypothetical protein
MQRTAEVRFELAEVDFEFLAILFAKALDERTKRVVLGPYIFPVVVDERRIDEECECVPHSLVNG